MTCPYLNAPPLGLPLERIAKIMAENARANTGDIDPEAAGLLAQKLREMMLRGNCGELSIGDDFLVTLKFPEAAGAEAALRPS